jgi:hypothetical protein
MNKAVKVRKSRQGVGTVYKLEPPYEWQDKQWEFAVARSYKAEILNGLLGVPAQSLLFLATFVEEDSSYKRGPKVLDIYGQTRSEAAILKSIGYTVNAS